MNASTIIPSGPRPARRSNRPPGSPPLVLIYGLLALPLLFLLVFNYVPAASALYHAFTEWDVGAESRWIGLGNFKALSVDPVFRQSLWNLFRLGCFVLIVNLSVPFLVAEMIFHLRSERARYACRVALVLPMVVPGVVVFMIWKYIYSDAGLVTEGLLALGLRDWVYGWLSHPKTALWAVAFVGFPFAHGVHALIYYAGLANISPDILEAAEVDGLGPIGRIVRIHVPLILQQAKLLLIITVIGVVNGFEAILILTEDGGPGYETLVPGLYMYQNGFTYQRMGYACAIGLLMLMFLLAFTIS
ncbi:MAG: sugar ABC transporter permease, partial [Candidatus Omnitrophica bacterium]|nr:sugar ABC transporter permease [Candidatus Omnitrophota bacterium]